MCGRYTLANTEDLFARFQVEVQDLDLAPRYNVAPDQVMPVVVREEANRLERMQWGLIPSWSKEPKSLAINARIEGILTKPSFRGPIRRHRGLIPATGFFEWKKEPAGQVPYYIRQKDGGLFAFAGIFDTWQAPDGEAVKTFAIVTTAPNSLLAQVHNRMPVILEPAQEAEWLDTKATDIAGFLESLRPLPPDQLEMYPVSRRVNWARNDFPDLILQS